MIIEGIYALGEKLRPLLDLRISVTGGVHFDLVKRVLRDIQRAGQEPEEIIQQISETVLFCYISLVLLNMYIFGHDVAFQVLSVTVLCRYIQCTKPLLSQISKQHI